MSVVPSVYDTHCEGPGLLPTTTTWSAPKRFYYKYLADDPKTYDLPPRQDLTGKNVLISGANSGIGRECAITCARWGARVVLACRDTPPTSHETHARDVIDEIVEITGCNKENLEWWEVDYSSLESLHALGKRWVESGRTCDYLFNNAGLSSGQYTTTKDGFELTYQVNYLAHCLLTHYMLPTMKDAEAPRIINTCSCFHYGGTLDFANLNHHTQKGTGLSGVQYYCNTKLLLTIWTFELQARLSQSEDYRHVVTHAVHPGFVASGIWQNPQIRALPKFLTSPLDWAVSNIAVTPHQGAMTMLYSAFLPENGFDVEELKKGTPASGRSVEVGAKFFNRITPAPPRPEVLDLQARARLWQRTREDLNLEKLGLGTELPGHSNRLR